MSPLDVVGAMILLFFTFFIIMSPLDVVGAIYCFSYVSLFFFIIMAPLDVVGAIYCFSPISLYNNDNKVDVQFACFL